MFCSTKFLKKNWNLQKRALRFLLNNYVSTYEDLLDKTDRSSMNVNKIQMLRVEIYKTINTLNIDFMK